MGLANQRPLASQSELLRQYEDKWAPEDVLSIYSDAFPDEKETLDELNRQYGGKATLDILRESLTERVELPETIEQAFPPAVPRLDIKAPDIPAGETQAQWTERTLSGLQGQGYTPEQVEGILPVISGEEVPAAPPEPLTGPIEIIPFPKRPKHPAKYNVVGGLRIFFEGLKLVPPQAGARLLSAVQGSRGASVADRGWADRIIQSSHEDPDKLVKDAHRRYKNQMFLPGISIADVANLPRNIGFSAGALGPAVAAGGPISLVPIPGMRGVGLAVGTVVAGGAAFNMASYEIMQEYLEIKNEEMQQREGRDITLAEEKRLKAKFSSEAKKYGAWEAIPEALSGAFGVSVLLKPISRIAGRSIATRIVGKLAKIYGAEMISETVTEMGQLPLRERAELPGGREVDWASPGDWYAALKDIAPQTALLTSVMAGTGAAVIQAGRGAQAIGAVRKQKQAQVAVDQLAKEIGRDDPDFHNFVEKIEAVEPDTALDFGALPEMPEGVVPAGRPAEQMPIAIPELEPEVQVEEVAPAAEAVAVEEPAEEPAAIDLLRQYMSKWEPEGVSAEEESVANTLAAGGLVPPDVLAQYPELQEQYGAEMAEQYGVELQEPVPVAEPEPTVEPPAEPAARTQRDVLEELGYTEKQMAQLPSDQIRLIVERGVTPDDIKSGTAVGGAHSDKTLAEFKAWAKLVGMEGDLETRHKNAVVRSVQRIFNPRIALPSKMREEVLADYPDILKDVREKHPEFIEPATPAEPPVQQPPPGAYEEEAAGKTEPEFIDEGPPVGMSIRQVIPPEIEVVKEPKDLVGWTSHLMDWVVPRRLFIPIFKDNPAVSRIIHMARDTLDRMSGEMRHYADRIDQAFKPLKRKEWKELIALLETPGRPEGMSPKFEEAYNAVDVIRKEALDMIQNEMGIDISEWGMSPEEYWPHIFVGSYQIVTQAAGAEAGAAWKTIEGGFSKTLREAVDKASSFLRSNPDVNIRIQPRQMRSDYDATLLTRKGFFNFLGEVEKATELDKDEIMSMMKGVAAIKPRGKFVGNFMQRQSNLGGYVEEPFALKVYMNRVLRKKWLDPFRKEATNLAATMPPALAGFFGEYIDSVSGKFDPKDKNFTMSKAAAHITRAQAYMKLGFRPVTAMLNRLQPMQLAFPEIGHYLWRGNLYKRTAGGKELLEKSGIYGQAPKYAAGEASFRAKPTEKIYHPLGLFSKAEMANREDVIVGGYLFAQKVFEMPRSRAASWGYDYILEYLDSYEDPREAALEYAKDLNADVNFIYNAADLPRMFQSKTGRLLFQFRTYPINFLATTMKWTLEKPDNIHYWTRLSRLVGTNVILGGVRSVPYIGRNLWKALVLTPLLFPLFSDREKKAKRVLLRGMFTQLGIDLSRRLGPNEFIPNDLRQLLGPSANDLFHLYEFARGDIEMKDLMRLVPAIKDFYVGITASHGIKDPNKRMRKVLEVSGWQQVLQAAGAPLEKVQVVKDFEFLRKEMERELTKNRIRYVDQIIARIDKGEGFADLVAEAVELGLGEQEIGEEVTKKMTPELIRGLGDTAVPNRITVTDMLNKIDKVYNLIDTPKGGK